MFLHRDLVRKTGKTRIPVAELAALYMLGEQPRICQICRCAVPPYIEKLNTKASNNGLALAKYGLQIGSAILRTASGRLVCRTTF